MVRTGIGFDVHKLIEGRRLILGGVEIDFPKGLLGHSDADVVSHAIADALLGAASFGDIGLMFPDTEPAFKDISSLKILEAVESRIKEAGYQINNVDVTIIAQQPKVMPFAENMKKKLAETLSIEITQVNIKGKTTEMLGFIGREEGVAALAVATIEK